MEVRGGSQGSEPGSRDVDKLIEKGLNIYSEGNIQEAMNIWQQVLSMDPDNMIAKEYIKNAQNDLREKNVPLEGDNQHVANNEIFYDPETSADQFETPAEGFASVSQGKPGDRAGMSRVTDEKDVKNLLNTANEYEIEGNMVAARETYEKIISIDPTNIHASKRLAKLSQQLDSAEEISRLINNGEKYFQEKKYERAMAEWKKALDLKPGDSDLLSRVEKAKNAVEAAPFIANCLRKGQEYVEQGEYQSAMTEWKKILSIEPDNQEVLENIKMTENMLQKTPADTGKLETGKSLLESGDYQGAVSMFEDVLNEDPDNEQAIQLYLKAKAQLDSLQEPTTFSEEIIEEEPEPEETPEDEPVITRTSDFEEPDIETTSSIGSWGSTAKTVADDLKESPKPTVTPDKKIEPVKPKEKFPIKMIIYPAIILIVVGGILYGINYFITISKPNIEPRSQDNAAKKLAEKHYQHGLALMDQGKHDQAIVAFNQALQLYPDFKEARDKFKEADMLLNPSKLPPERKAALIAKLFQKAEDFEKLEKYHDAQAVYEDILRIDKTNNKAKEKYIEADDKIRTKEKKELMTAPTSVQLHKAKEYYAITRYQDALDLLNNILRKEPGNKEARKLKKDCEGRIRSIKERTARADDMYKKGLRFMEEEKYGKAIAQFRRILQFYPAYKKAKIAIKKATKLRKKQEEIIELLRVGEWSYDRQRYDDALENFERLLELDPDNETAKFYISKIKEYKALGTFTQ